MLHTSEQAPKTLMDPVIQGYVTAKLILDKMEHHRELFSSTFQNKSFNAEDEEKKEKKGMRATDTVGKITDARTEANEVSDFFDLAERMGFTHLSEEAWWDVYANVLAGTTTSDDEKQIESACEEYNRAYHFEASATKPDNKEETNEHHENLASST